MARDTSSTRRGGRTRPKGPAATSGRASAARSVSRRPGSRERIGSASIGRPSQIRRSTPHPTRATPAAANRSRARPGGITGRAITLGLLVIALVLLLVYPISSYVQQQSDIAALHRQIADTRGSISSLEKQLALLSDPAYVEGQARARLNYQFPGDRVYVVADNGPGSAAQKQVDDAAVAKAKADSSALGDLADSVAKADGGG